MRAREATRLKQVILVLDDLRGRKQWVDRAKQFLDDEIFHPVDNELADIIPDREEPCGEGLRELRGRAESHPFLVR